MRITNTFFAAAGIIITVSCTHSPRQASAVVPVAADTLNKVKKESFFPVTSFLKGQMLVLDSLPVTPLHTNKTANKTDSLWMKKTQLIPLLKDFLSPEIKETNLTQYFKEASFNDQTLNAITFTYDPITVLPDSISLRHWDVYINPETGKVFKVYMVKQWKEKDGSIVTKQLTWKTDQWAMIVTFTNKPGNTIQLLKEDKFTWNFNE